MQINSSLWRLTITDACLHLYGGCNSQRRVKGDAISAITESCATFHCEKRAANQETGTTIVSEVIVTEYFWANEGIKDRLARD